MRRPAVVALEQKTIRQIRSGGTPAAHVVALRRWYVTLDFGGSRARLSVPARAVRWMRSSQTCAEALARAIAC